MANNDRVLELYQRRIFSAAAQDACRDRVNWLCRSALGPRVLDIGCSQGIASIILAREGRRVVGIDIEPQQIETAREAIGAEPPHVQERVEFIAGDVFDIELEAGSFDSVLIGEVLEHLVSPQLVLERVSRWLRDEGRLIVSVPLGYEPFHDHKNTFHLLDLIDLLGERFTVSEVDALHGKYLCAVALKPPAGQSPRPPTLESLRGWLARCEAASETAERQSYYRITKLTQERDAHRERVRKLVPDADRLRAQIGDSRQQLQEAEQKEQALSRQFQDDRAASERLTHQLREELRKLSEEAALEAASSEQLTDALQQARDLEKQAHRSRDELHRQLLDGQKRIAELEGRLRVTQDDVKAAGRTFRIEHVRLEDVLRSLSEQRAVARKALQQLQFARTSLELREGEVRYQLGDALVRAAKPSKDTLLLPFRIASLFRRGLRRTRARRQDRQSLGITATISGPAQLPPPRPHVGDAQREAAPKHANPPTTAAGGRTERSADNADESDDPTHADVQPRRADPRLAGVLPAGSARCWRYEAPLRLLEAGDEPATLEAWSPRLLLVETPRASVDDAWYLQLHDLGKHAGFVSEYRLPKLIEWCRQRGVPTVFWNTQDPGHFESYIEAARLFDVVCTLDDNCVAEYCKRLGHDRVLALPYAAQPGLHNPIDRDAIAAEGVCFVGTWQAHPSANFQKEAGFVLDPALDFDLCIYDPERNGREATEYWPKSYWPAIQRANGAGPSDSAFRRHKVALNLNTLKNSATHCPRRVFEALACGVPVVGAPSKAVENLFGDNVVLPCADEDSVRKHLVKLLGDDDYRSRLSLRCQRKVFSAHTYTHRLRAILDAAGLAADFETDPRMSFVVPLRQPADVPAAAENFRRQHYPNKHLLLCLRDATLLADAKEMRARAPDMVTVVSLPQGVWGATLANAGRHCKPGLVALMNPGHFYGPDYLTDYANAGRYVAGGGLGKQTYYSADPNGTPRVTEPGAEYRFTDRVQLWTLCLSTALFREQVESLQNAESPDEWAARLQAGLDRLYSSDRFNFVCFGPREAGDVNANGHCDRQPTASRLSAALA